LSEYGDPLPVNAGKDANMKLTKKEITTAYRNYARAHNLDQSYMRNAPTEIKQEARKIYKESTLYNQLLRLTTGLK
jgi:hypothetical protein